MPKPRLSLPRLSGLLLAGLMATAPGLALAQGGCGHAKAQSCAVGYEWDPETKSCVLTTT
jgi:hypothetical protein